MSTRTVRLDAESEKILSELQRETGLSASHVLRRGLVALRASLREEVGGRPYEVYEQLDLGPGGYAKAPAREAQRAIREVLSRKRER
jgi:hypothetical protein